MAFKKVEKKVEPKVEKKEVKPVVVEQLDPSLPESKQRWLRQ